MANMSVIFIIFISSSRLVLKVLTLLDLLSNEDEVRGDKQKYEGRRHYLEPLNSSSSSSSLLFPELVAQWKRMASL